MPTRTRASGPRLRSTISLPRRARVRPKAPPSRIGGREGIGAASQRRDGDGERVGARTDSKLHHKGTKATKDCQLIEFPESGSPPSTKTIYQFVFGVGNPWWNDLRGKRSFVPLW